MEKKDKLIISEKVLILEKLIKNFSDLYFIDKDKISFKIINKIKNKIKTKKRMIYSNSIIRKILLEIQEEIIQEFDNL